MAFYIYPYLQHFLHKVNAIFPEDFPDKEFARFEGWILATSSKQSPTEYGWLAATSGSSTWKFESKMDCTTLFCGFGATNNASSSCAINLLIIKLFIVKQRLFENDFNQFTNFRNL
jgi:hypothetical protein